MRLDYKRYVTFLLGILILTLGVSLTVKSGIGAGSYDSINFALSDLLRVSVSLTISATSLLMVFLAAFVRRSFPRFITFVTSVIMGTSTDMWVQIIKNLNPETLLIKMFIFVIGMLLMCIGLAVYLVPKLPANPADDFMVALTERGFSIRKAKLSIDITCIIIAFILKGPIGIGTIILTFGIGPVVDFIHGNILRIFYGIDAESTQSIN
jgi:uncharacterized membrane protein YczE